MTASIGATNALTIAGGAAARSGQDFYPARFSAAGTAKGAVVFAGFGITWAERGYDDYRGDVKGKIVLVIDHEPGERDPASPFDGLVTSEAGGPLRKALAAQDKGAAGILFVSDVHNHPGDANFEQSARALLASAAAAHRALHASEPGWSGSTFPRRRFHQRLPPRFSPRPAASSTICRRRRKPRKAQRRFRCLASRWS